MSDFKRMVDYNEQFVEYYRDWFSDMPLECILTYEENLSALIDSNLYDGFCLQDEVNVLYELIRDECVKRCQLSIGYKAEERQSA